MPKSRPSDTPTEQASEPVLEDSFYEIPPELQEEPSSARRRGERDARATSDEPGPLEEPPAEAAGEGGTTGEAVLKLQRRFPVVKVGLAVGVLVCVGAAVMAFRTQGRRKAVAEGVASAEQLMRLDTAESYRKAADLLAPHAQLDPLQAGSARAFALAMLAADYRDSRAESEANALLVVPGRADSIPPQAALAFAALALGRNVLGDATSALAGAPGNPWAEALRARIALRAGTLDAAVEPAIAAAAPPGFAAGLAVHGDAARRAKKDGRTARAAYEAALAASPFHPRAAFGLAKLALEGQAPEPEAREALQRLLSNTEATPAPERLRAALHLAALRIRAGDAVDAVRAELAVGLSQRAADWLMGAARAEASNHGPYRAVSGAPEGLESASDDDPPDLKPLSPEPPPPPPPPPPPRAAEPSKAKAAPAKAALHGKQVRPGKVAPAAKAGGKSSSAKHPAPKTGAAKKKPGTKRTH